MRDLYSNDVETAAELAAFEELPAELPADFSDIADNYSDLEQLRSSGWLDIPIEPGDFLRGILDGTPDIPF